MATQEILVRKAVLASLRNDKKLAESNVQNNESQQVAPSSDNSTLAISKQTKRERTKRKGSTATDSNWKQLQKAMEKEDSTNGNKRKRFAIKQQREKIRKLQNGDKQNVNRRYSSFMTRAVEDSKDITHAVAMDCEMVGVGTDGKESALARVSVVNYNGDVLYDKFVKVRETIMDYRTKWSGIRPQDVSIDSKTAVEEYEAQQTVGELLKGRTLIGHALKNDLRVLRIAHPWKDVRDTSEFYKKLWKKKGRRSARPPALREVVAKVLGVDAFQKTEHDSCEDARAALALYKRNAKQWEAQLRRAGLTSDRKNKRQIAQKSKPVD